MGDSLILLGCYEARKEANHRTGYGAAERTRIKTNHTIFARIVVLSLSPEPTQGENDEISLEADSTLCHVSPFSGMEAHARIPAGRLAHCTDRRVQHGFKRDKGHSHHSLWRSPHGVRREHRAAFDNHRYC